MRADLLLRQPYGRNPALARATQTERLQRGRNKKCTMRILLNAVSAKMGGAATYIRNIASELESLAPDDEFICVVPEEQVDRVRGVARNFRVIGTPISNAPYLRRLWFDQVTLRRLLRSERIDVLYS